MEPEGAAQFVGRLDPGLDIRQLSGPVKKEKGDASLVGVLSGKGPPFSGSHIRDPKQKLVIGKLVFDRADMTPELGTDGAGYVVYLDDRRDPVAYGREVILARGYDACGVDEPSASANHDEYCPSRKREASSPPGLLLFRPFNVSPLTRCR